MNLYVVTFCGSHGGCIDNWRNMDDTDVEAIFDSLEKAKQYVLDICSESDVCDGYYDSESYWITLRECNRPFSLDNEIHTWTYDVADKKWWTNEEEL